MNIEQIYQQYGVEYITENSHHRHSQTGWINVECPFCTGNHGYHLGFNLDESYFHCWRCGGHNASYALSKICAIPQHKAKEILQESGPKKRTKEKKIRFGNKIYKTPDGVGILQKSHRQYLSDRLFNPIELWRKYKIMGTGVYGNLDGMDLKHRLFIPIFWNGQEVTWQTRDITNKAATKYITCPPERERVHHKHILYGRQHKWTEQAIIVEGVTDVWKLGDLAVATFGIKYKLEQQNEIVNNFTRTCVLFDNDPQAIKQGEKLKNELNARRVRTAQIIIQDKDPGQLKKSEAIWLVKFIQTMILSDFIQEFPIEGAEIPILQIVRYGSNKPINTDLCKIYYNSDRLENGKGQVWVTYGRYEMSIDMHFKIMSTQPDFDYAIANKLLNFYLSIKKA